MSAIDHSRFRRYGLDGEEPRHGFHDAIPKRAGADERNGATDYVRGIPVVKVFQQTVYSFSAFHDAIVDFARLATEHAVRGCENPQSLLLAAVTGSAIFLVPAMLVIVPGEQDMAAFFGGFRVLHHLFRPHSHGYHARDVHHGCCANCDGRRESHRGVLGAPVIEAPADPREQHDKLYRVRGRELHLRGGRKSGAFPCVLRGSSGIDRGARGSFRRRQDDGGFPSCRASGMPTRAACSWAASTCAKWIRTPSWSGVAFVFQAGRLFRQSSAACAR